MKAIIIFIVGGLLWLPIMFVLCTNSITAQAFGLIYGIFLWNSPKISPKVKRFWRIFHKVNFQIINSIK